MLSPAGFSIVVVMDDKDTKAILVVDIQVMKFVPLE